MDVSVKDKGVYAFGPFRLDPVRRTLTREGTAIKLAARLFDTLLYLIEAQGRIVEKDELLAAIWPGRIVEEGNLAQAISTLRKALQTDGGAENYIVTTPGRGYRFAAPVRVEGGAPDPAMLSLPQAPDVRPALGPAMPGAGKTWRRRAGVMIAAATMAIGAAVAITALRPRGDPETPAFAPPPHSVAVLAFTNMSGDPSQDYFSDGLAEELIDTLGLINQIHVAARVSAFSFKGKPATVAEIARALNVGAVLDGSVRREGNRVRIAVHLIDARTGYQTWSKTYDRDQGGILKLEAEIARAVTESLQVRLAGDETGRLPPGGTGNPAALDAFLRGMSLKNGGNQSAATAQAALAAFGQAVSLDPNYALAQTWRAKTLCDLAMIGAFPDAALAQTKFAEALANADKAIALAPQLGVAHAVRGYILANGFLNFVAADASVTQALALAPEDPLVLATFAYQEANYGRSGKALAVLRRAADHDPLNPRSYSNLATVQFYARDYQGALESLRHELALRGQSTIRIVGFTGLNQLLSGDAAAARQTCAAEQDWLHRVCLAAALHTLGKQDEAADVLARLHTTMGDDGAYQYAQVYAQWGDAPNAVHWLQAAYRLRDPGMTALKVDPLLDPVRNAPGFTDIERMMNFPP
jgi:TolB-like protein/DNA-binding winged helix-turn-helix (wHTH) protein/Flp pilus assembly protein TadD